MKFALLHLIAVVAISPFFGQSKTSKKEITFKIDDNNVINQEAFNFNSLGKKAGIFNGQINFPGQGGGSGNEGGGNDDGGDGDDNGGNSGGWTIPGDVTIGIHDDDPIYGDIGQIGNGDDTVGGGLILGPITEGPGSSETSTLTTYHDSGDDDSYNGHTYFAPVRTGESGILVGTLKNRYNQYFEDWFLFTVDVKSELVISFNQRPSNSYLYEIYEFGSCPNRIYSFEEEGSVTSYLDVDAGSYYIKVYCKISNNATQDQYSITYVTSFVEKETSISWYGEETKMLVWESDSIPTNINHWDGNYNLFYRGDEAEMNGYQDHLPDFGYLDPLYRRENDSVDTDAVFLDSVMYMWDRDDLFAYGQFLNQLINEITQAMIDHENKPCTFKTWKIIIDGAIAVVSLCLSFGGANVPISLSVGVGLTGFVSYICGLFTSPQVSASETAILINNLTELKCDCFNANEHQAVAIPRHAILQKDGSYGVYWKTGFYPQHTASTPDGIGFYIVEKDAIISSLRNPKYNSRTESGFFTEYSNFNDFVSQTGYTNPHVEGMVPTH